MPPEGNAQSVMRQRLDSAAMQGLHSRDESLAGFDVVCNNLAAAAWVRCLLASPQR